MTNRLRWIWADGRAMLLGVAGLVMLGCAEPASPPAEPSTPAEGATATAAALLEADRAFAAMAVEEGAAVAFRAYLSPDAVRLPPGMYPMRTREAIYRSMTKGPAATLTWTPVAAEGAASGDLGYTWGTYELRLPDATGAVEYGTYLTVWELSAEGAWRVAAATSNTSPGPWSP